MVLVSWQDLGFAFEQVVKEVLGVRELTKEVLEVLEQTKEAVGVKDFWTEAVEVKGFCGPRRRVMTTMATTMYLFVVT